MTNLPFVAMVSKTVNIRRINAGSMHYFLKDYFYKGKLTLVPFFTFFSYCSGPLQHARVTQFPPLSIRRAEISQPSLHSQHGFHTRMQRADVRKYAYAACFELPRLTALNVGGTKAFVFRTDVMRERVPVLPDDGVSGFHLKHRRRKLQRLDNDRMGSGFWRRRRQGAYS